MNTNHFEKAIDALGVQGLEITKFSYGINGQVVRVYARMSELKYIMWDANGRGFVFEINENEEGQWSGMDTHPEYLDYRRDAGFDLTFE